MADDKNGGAGAGASGSGEGNKGSGTGGGTPTVEQLQAVVAALTKEKDELTTKHAEVTKESIDRRHKLSAAEKELEKVKPIAEALKTHFGTNEDDKVKKQIEEAKAGGDAKLKRAILRSEFMSEASKAGIVNPARAYAAFERELGDVTVDVEKESADGKAIAAKLSELRKSDPYFFAIDADGKPIVKGTVAPGATSLNGGSNEYEQFQKLTETGDLNAAAQFFRANEKKIRPHLKK